MFRQGRLDKAKSSTGMFPFAGLTLKSIKNMDQKIGWRSAFLGDFFWLLKRSHWLVGTRVILVMDDGKQRECLAHAVCKQRSCAVWPKAINKRSACFVHRLKSPRASKANAGQIAGSNLSESRVGNAFSRPVSDETRRDQ
ncbi:hypothetical protein FX988_03482 [Paraglaciecola mesophila]|uniref:Uncharacterized protein n=1 Tax=Paraglaciecola mesophila TaxID=197222 RepID=A0A857JQ75_9ALTE|nr:hypothetical protein FX988_03482 [Paraglaciecola mesophila]